MNVNNVKVPGVDYSVNRSSNKGVTNEFVSQFHHLMEPHSERDNFIPSGRASGKQHCEVYQKHNFGVTKQSDDIRKAGILQQADIPQQAGILQKTDALQQADILQQIENKELYNENDGIKSDKESSNDKLESETTSNIVVNPDGSRVLVVTMKVGGMETAMSIQLSKPSEFPDSAGRTLEDDAMRLEQTMEEIEGNSI